MPGFPTSPSNNQLATVNGITYIYTSTKTAWVRNTTSGTDLVANSISVTNSVVAASFLGDGSGLTGLSAGYTNSDVAAYLPTYLPTYTGVITDGTATMSSGALSGVTTVTASGAITASSFIGSGSQLTGIPVPRVAHTVYTGKTTYAFATAGQTGTYIAVLDTTITPTKTSSKVRVEFNISFEVQHDTIFRLWRVISGVTTEVVRNSDGNYWSGFAYPGYDVDTNSTARTNHYIYIDSPNTTSAVTYRLMIQSGGVGATTFYLNRPVGALGQANYENAISQCMLTEVLA